MTSGASDKTTDLPDFRSVGNRVSLDALMPLVYDELRRRARAYMRAENAGHTLQTTALIHEAYLRLVSHENAEWKDRAHFFGVASQIIRHVLIDHARGRRRLKRGGNPALKVELSDNIASTQPNGFDLIGIDGAIDKLTAVDAQQGRIVELRFYGGLSIEETAGVLKISPATVKRDWAMARAWLYRELTAHPEKH